METTYKCKLDNRWNWSTENAGMIIDSPTGGFIWIFKVDFNQMKDQFLEEAQLIEEIKTLMNGDVDLTRTQMQHLLNVAKKCPSSIYHKGSRKLNL